jgi:hypothetical protein
MALSTFVKLARRILRAHEQRRPPRPRLTLEILEDRVTPSAVSWTGHGDGTSWGDGRNWSTGQVPGAGDDVTVNAFGANIVHTTADTVNSLTLSGGNLTDLGNLTLQNLSVGGFSTLTGPGTETVNGSFTWTGGTLSGTGTTLLEGASTLSGGFFTMLNGRTLTNDGTATFTGGGIDVQGNGVVNNDAGATAILQGNSSVGNFFAGPKAAFNNAGLLQKLGAGPSGVGIPLNNTGTVDVEQDTLTLTTGASSGTFNLANGTLNFSNAFTAGYTLQDGATGTGHGAIQVGTFNALNVTGTVHLNYLIISGGTVTANAGSSLTADFLTESGGNLTGPGSVSTTDIFDWTGGTLSGPGTTTLHGVTWLTGGFFTQLNGRTVTNNGFAVFYDSGIDVQGNGVWNNSAGATTLLFQGASVGSFFAGPGAAFNNAGMLAVLGSGNPGIAVALNNTGLVDVQQGTLALSTGASSGIFDVESGAVLSFSNAFSSGYTLQDGATAFGVGSVQVNTFNTLNTAGNVSVTNLTVGGGTVNVSGALSVNSLALNGTLTGPGNVTVNGGFVWTGGGLSGTGQTFLEGTSTLSGGFFASLTDRTVNNDGTATVTNGGFTVEGNGVWNNDAGGTTILQGGASVGNFFAGPNAAFNNAGLLKTAGGGTATVAVPLTNAATGTVQLQAGSLSLGFFPGPFQTAGTVTVGAGNTFLVGNYTQTGGTTTVDGVLSLTNPFISGAAVSVNGGVLKGAGMINGNVVNAAEVDPGDSPGVLTINGNYSQTAAGTLSIELGGRTAGSQYDRLTVSGTATLDGTLSVTLLNGFQPSPGDTFAVLTFGSHSGTFASYTGLDVGNGETLSPVFNPNGKEFDLVATSAS